MVYLEVQGSYTALILRTVRRQAPPIYGSRNDLDVRLRAPSFKSAPSTKKCTFLGGPGSLSRILIGYIVI